MGARRVWHGQKFWVVQTYHVWQGDRIKSCAGVKFKSTSDITLFTMEITKLFLKQKLIISVCL